MTNAHQPLAHSSTEIRWPGRTLGLMRKASFAGNGRLFGLELARTCREQNESRLWTRIIGRQKKMTVQVVFHDRAHMTGRCMLSTLLLRNLERVQNKVRHAVCTCRSSEDRRSRRLHAAWTVDALFRRKQGTL